MPTSPDVIDFERLHALRDRLPCPIHTDPLTRALYSTDASIYQIEPLAVAYPRHEDDLQAIVEAAAGLGIPLLPRGAGTSLAGQAVGAALVIDCARHLDRTLTLDPESHTVEVAPGVVGAALNRAASAHGLMLGPDPASADRATVGGMIANNATGAHSVRYGMLADHVVEIEAILSDGSLAHFGRLSEGEAERKMEAGGREGEIYGAALRLRRSARESIRAAWPGTWRRSSGYSLDYLVGCTPGRPSGWYADPGPYPPHPDLNLAPVLCGSEGTLAVIRRARLNLVPRPPATVLVVIPFESIEAASEATPRILETHPSAVELVPRVLIDRARDVPDYARKASVFMPAGKALLVVEFAGESLEAARAAASPISSRGEILLDAEAQADLWAVRKAGLGLLLSVPGDLKPVSFIEDITVPVERLAEYVRRMDGLLAEHGTRGEWYAHASAGCLHMRPLLDLKGGDGVTRLRAIAEGAVEIVLDMRGVLSGEHGDGLAHTEFNGRMFGPEVRQAFVDLKRAFDPDGLLNPGKIVPALGSDPPRMDTSLRYGPGYRTASWPTHFAFRREGGIARAIEACNGAGVCLTADGVMCPSYQALREERHSTRGRANALRAALSGRLGPQALTSEAIREVLDLCLACKGCGAECPSAVDLAKVKVEFLDRYQAERGVPLRSRIFGEIAALSGLAAPFAGVINPSLGHPRIRGLLERLVGIARQRRLPAFTGESFRAWVARRAAPAEGEPVVLFVDTFVEHNHPQVGRSAVRVLEAAGCRVLLAPGQGCCGRALISKGMLSRAKQLASRNLACLAPFAESGIPILGLEPSCLATLRDEYLDFFPDDPRAQAIAQVAFLFEEYMLRVGEDGRRPIDRLDLAPLGGELWVHGHCHAKALAGPGPLLEVMRATGATVREIEAGCCGMAGSFGYEVEHYELSMRIGESRLFPAVRQALQQSGDVVAAGASCRAQIRDGTGVEAWHPVEVVDRALGRRDDHDPAERSLVQG
jgi:FAD/FMN-containing dehydrogenase/Fe-S oxidoreductase